MDNDCPHLIPDATDKCIDCGADMPPINLPPDYEPNLGDVMAICKLLDETRRSFDKVIVANTDPKTPSFLACVWSAEPSCVSNTRWSYMGWSGRHSSKPKASATGARRNVGRR